MKKTVTKTGIFQQTRRTPENEHDRKELVVAFVDGFDAKKRLDEIDATLAAITAPYIVRQFPNSSHLFGDLAPDAEQIVIRARDLRVNVEQARRALAANNTQAAIIYALDLGWALCHMGAEQFEPEVLKAQKASDDRKNAEAQRIANAAKRQQRTVDAALTLWQEHSAKSLTWVREQLANNDAVRKRFPGLPNSLTTIEKHTKGLTNSPPKAP